MTVLKAFRLPTRLANRLFLLAKVTHHSEKFYLTEALVHYFENYVDARIARDRFKDTKSKIISGVKLRKRLGVYP